MDERACIRCGRGIDASAKLCPFCNWDQERPAPATTAPRPIEVAEYRPPGDRDLRRKAFIAGGVVLLLIVSFVVGMLINRDGAPKRAPETVEEQKKGEATVSRRADTPLEPVGVGGLTQPITSAPALTPATGGVPDEYHRTDATAVSAAEYARMAQRANAESAQQKSTALVDPRSITGNAWGATPLPRRARPAPAASQQASNDATSASSAPQRARAANVRTRPIPRYQPLPRISATGTARLTLLVGADGNVKQVGIDRALQGGNTAALLSAVQSWRFKPATENGDPVAAPYSVEISFKRD
jgi:TonB family protein